MRPAIAYIKKKFGDQKLIGAEVGVGNGNHAIEIIQELSFETLYLVDHWQSYWEDGQLIETFAGRQAQVVQRFQNYPAAKIIAEASPGAAEKFSDKFFDFVYLDACPCFDCVCLGIKAWRPKVKIGGILAGHDYHWAETRRAVDEIFQEETLIISGRDWMRDA